jgi:hypothetical protein
MSSYKHILNVDDHTSEQLLKLAADWLERNEGVVVLNGVIALRPGPVAIVCEVIDPTPAAHRCGEEFRVLVENAARTLAASQLASRLPQRPLQWRVVDQDGRVTWE